MSSKNFPNTRTAKLVVMDLSLKINKLKHIHSQIGNATPLRHNKPISVVKQKNMYQSISKKINKITMKEFINSKPPTHNKGKTPASFTTGDYHNTPTEL
jgi:hypothetical protein